MLYSNEDEQDRCGHKASKEKLCRGEGEFERLSFIPFTLYVWESIFFSIALFFKVKQS